jgi:hypothetical protein
MSLSPYCTSPSYKKRNPTSHPRSGFRILSSQFVKGFSDMESKLSSIFVGSVVGKLHLKFVHTYAVALLSIAYMNSIKFA